MKQNNSKPRWQNKLKHFKLGFTFRIRSNRVSELKQLLASANLGDDLCRTTYTKFNSVMRLDVAGDVFISFRHAKHATWFKLSWELCDINDDTTFGKVIVPIIRRVMPNVIASDILGVQPMTGPVSQVFSLRSRHAATPAPDEDEG